MKKIWIHVKFKLIDPEHKKPDRHKAVTFSIAELIEEIEENLKAIEKLINEGYIIEEMRVVSG